jgi:hypothetical protein
MLGSVYLHTVAAASKGGRELERDLDEARAEGRGSKSGSRELSGAERIRPLAAEKLGMRAPGSEDLQVYGRDGRMDTKLGRRGKGDNRGSTDRRRAGT